MIFIYGVLLILFLYGTQQNLLKKTGKAHWDTFEQLSNWSKTDNPQSVLVCARSLDIMRF